MTLDSTILVRAHRRAAGPARALLVELLQRGHRLVLSGSLLEEVERVLHYPRLVKRFALTDAEITAFVSFLAASADVVGVDEATPPPIRDPNDVHILQTAITGKSNVSARPTKTFMKRRWSNSVRIAASKSFPISTCCVWFEMLTSKDRDRAGEDGRPDGLPNAITCRPIRRPGAMVSAGS